MWGTVEEFGLGDRGRSPEDSVVLTNVLANIRIEYRDKLMLYGYDITFRFNFKKLYILQKQHTCIVCTYFKQTAISTCAILTGFY
jgi:hypothetical protein